MNNAWIILRGDGGEEIATELSITRWVTSAQFSIGLPNGATYFAPHISLDLLSLYRKTGTSPETKPGD